MVPETGLEPARIAPLPPQGSVSTNFTTPAGGLLHPQKVLIQGIRALHPSGGLQPSKRHSCLFVYLLLLLLRRHMSAFAYGLMVFDRPLPVGRGSQY